jgi:predicted nucleic acid-binding protein
VIPVALLDANVLIALIDPRHVHHESCHRWFSSRGEAPWASCVITQNAVLRIVGHPRYPNSPGSPAVVSRILEELERLRDSVVSPLVTIVKGHIVPFSITTGSW